MLLLTLFLGFITSYLGMITPSMLNITAIKISIEKGKKTAINYAIGVSVIVIIQGFFALFFLKIIYKNPVILETIETAAIFVFALLSFFFFRKAFLDKKQIQVKKITQSGFLAGVGLSFINMFSVPFYCGVGAILNMNGWLDLEIISISFFVLGSTLGTFFILYNYILLAERIKPKVANLSKYLNVVLGGITGIVALITLIKLM